MLPRRLYRIFLRYAEETATLHGPSCALHGPDGAVVGRLEGVILRANRMRLSGQISAEASSGTYRLGLRINGRESWSAPGLHDKLLALTLQVDLAYEPGDLEILTERDGAQFRHIMSGFSQLQVTLARGLRALPFLASLIRLAPVIWRWKRRGDPTAREVIKQELQLVPRVRAARLDPAVLNPTGDDPPCPFAAHTIVMPVHNAFEVTKEALARLADHSVLDWHLVVVEDASTDPDLRPWLKEWAAAQGPRITLLLNETNMGFVAAVNRGFEVAREARPEAPVVLLNSDALVPAGWDRRLLAPLIDPTVASVTPMSNEAEIFTIPVICAPRKLFAGEGDALDTAAATLNAAAARAPAPTGVGFCMALAPRFLAAVPRFDTTFGPGYGEETDWCQETRARGGRHLAAVDLFVEHRGGQSFGSATKQKLLMRNSAEISRRYPRYDAEVRDFIHHDPLATARLALGLSQAGLAANEPVPCYLGHAMGGGAETDMARRVAADVARCGSAVVLRVGQRARFGLELHVRQGVIKGLTEDPAVLRALFARLPRRRIIYSCGVGDRDAATLPDLLLALAGRGGDALPGGPQPIDVLMHDFFPISPSYTLLCQDGLWHGLPLPGTIMGNDPAHRYSAFSGETVDLAGWQARWGALLAQASRIEVFSENSRALISEAYPQVADAIVVSPHELHAPVPQLATSSASKREKTEPHSSLGTFGVLGNIGQHKGAAVLQALSREMARSHKPPSGGRLVVLGRLDPDYALRRPSRVHGPYEVRDLPGLVARYGISAWLIPSTWPETFSFTTHEALATGLPVLAFDLGAQGDAVAAAENGHLLSLEMMTDPAALMVALQESLQ